MQTDQLITYLDDPPRAAEWFRLLGVEDVERAHADPECRLARGFDRGDVGHAFFDQTDRLEQPGHDLVETPVGEVDTVVATGELEVAPDLADPRADRGHEVGRRPRTGAPLTPPSSGPRPQISGFPYPLRESAASPEH